MNDPILISELKSLGFTSFIHLDKSKRDGLARWTLTHPIENESEWFSARIVEEKDNLKIDLLSNPLGKAFHKNDISGLISYIKSEILKK